MKSTEAKQLLTRQIEAIRALSSVESSSPEFQKWKRNTEIVIERIFGASSRHLPDFKNISFRCGVYFSGMDPNSDFNACQRGLERTKVILESMIEEIEQFGFGETGVADRNCFDLVADLCGRFHLASRQLRQRHDSRPTLEVDDEYDVQDLLHALLHLHFTDIRPEEWTPSYAGSSSRMDFLLKQEKLVIEVKKTRKGLGAKEVGEQLIVDIERYQAHPDCKALICFVYDPEGRIANPCGLENDLNGDKSGINVRVIIAPKGA